jgi:GR25 family glycosyltransferase involved in LPS biosynthesis
MKAICLNLDKRTDRWATVQKEFAKQGLTVERFPAIEHDIPSVSFNYSQQAILKSITENTIVFEDDVMFVSDKLNEVLATAPEDWDVLYLGGNVMDNLKHVSGHWWRVKETWTTHAVIYTPKAAQWILNRYYPETSQIYDDFLRETVQPNLNCYICKPFICTQRPDFSDLWNTHADYGIIHTESKLT